MCTPATVGVDNNLSAGETGITLWATDDEEARWLDLPKVLACDCTLGRWRALAYVVLGVLVEVLGWDDLLDDLLLDLLTQLLGRDVLAVLRGNDNGVNTEGYNCTAIMLVLDGDLRLGVRSQPWHTS